MGKHRFKSTNPKKENTFKEQANSNSYKMGENKIPYEWHYPIFSFKDFIQDTKHYTIKDSNSDKRSLYNFLNAVKDFSNFTWGDIKRTKQFHAHGIDDDKIDTIKELKNMDNTPFFQFKLPKHKEGRFIGFFDDHNIFHIVLYDRNHELYPRK